MVDFVTDQNQIVTFREIGHTLQFFARPNSPTRIVRRAEDQHGFMPVHLRVPGVEIHFVAAIVVGQFAFHNLAARSRNHARKSVVDRCHQNDTVPGLREGVDANGRTIHQPMRGENLGRGDFPAMAVFHPPANRVFVRRFIAVIAIDALILHFGDRIRHTLRRAEIHISDPHRNAIVRWHAIDRLHHVPFHGMGAKAIDDFVEIHGGPHSNCCPARYPKAQRVQEPLQRSRAWPMSALC